MARRRARDLARRRGRDEVLARADGVLHADRGASSSARRVGLVLLWVKVVLDSLRRRRESCSRLGAIVALPARARLSPFSVSSEAVRRRPYRHRRGGRVDDRPLDAAAADALVARARAERRHRVRPRPPRLRRLPRPRAGSSTRSCRATTRSCSATWPSPSSASARPSTPARGSASTATTTSTASARRRSPCSSSASSARTPSWHLPSRFEEGYGVSSDTLAKLADDGVGLVLTVDCGITAVEEVAEAKALGLEVVVTDHHRPGDDASRLPDRRDAALGRTRSRSSAAPASSTSSARRCSAPSSPALRKQPRPRRARDDRGRRAARGREPRARRRRSPRARVHAPARAPGAHAERARRPGRGRRRVRSAFRLAPRINAAGRLGRPDIALELILTDDAARGAASSRQSSRS